MEHTPENDLQQAVELAQQAAAQMKRAANLAEHAAQLWQKTLALANQESLPQSPAAVQMSIADPKRKKKQHIRPETTRLIENAVCRKNEHLPSAPGSTGHAAIPLSENAWEEGDNWWKPRQQTSSSEV